MGDDIEECVRVIELDAITFICKKEKDHIVQKTYKIKQMSSKCVLGEVTSESQRSRSVVTADHLNLLRKRYSYYFFRYSHFISLPSCDG
jgi:hypothetical protein